mmetsp:Transcript_31735/g.72903  ORF Transcript_31735/g.72903 Transcript_31735/m.72903 type:complete len:107 (+) Transcript_31735:38-358(+)
MARRLQRGIQSHRSQQQEWIDYSILDLRYKPNVSLVRSVLVKIELDSPCERFHALDVHGYPRSNGQRHCEWGMGYPNTNGTIRTHGGKKGHRRGLNFRAARFDLHH